MSNKWDFSWDWIDFDLRQHFVSDEIRTERQKICKECDQLNGLNMCNICNCFMPGKTLLKSSDCPQGKWGSIE